MLHFRGSLFRHMGTGAVEVGGRHLPRKFISRSWLVTPWTIFGGKGQFLIAGPVVEIGVHRTT